SAEHGFEVNPERSEYEFAIQPVINAEEASILIRFDDIPAAEIQIDNVELYEANIVRTDPDEVVLFEVNPTKTSKTIPLNGTFIDPKNVEYKGSVTLEPFSSILLIKVAEAAKPVEEEVLPPAITIVSPTHYAAFEGPRSIDIQFEAERKGSGIRKVDCISGLKLLGPAK